MTKLAIIISVLIGSLYSAKRKWTPADVGSGVTMGSGRAFAPRRQRQKWKISRVVRFKGRRGPGPEAFQPPPNVFCCALTASPQLCVISFHTKFLHWQRSGGAKTCQHVPSAINPRGATGHWPTSEAKLGDSPTWSFFNGLCSAGHRYKHY